MTLIPDPSYLQKPIVYTTTLNKPGSHEIVSTAKNVVPQFSGMSFVRFFYAPGDYTGQAVNCWYLGLVRRPYFNKFCEFGETSTAARQISAGEVIVIKPQSEFSTEILTEGQVDYLVLTPGRVHQALSSQHQGAISTPRSKETYFQSKLISTLLDAVIGSASHPETFEPEHADNYINAIVSGLSQRNLNSEPNPKSGRLSLSSSVLRMLYDYIDASIQTPITNAQLAKMVDLPEAIFIKAFKASAGVTPYQFVLKTRIERAKTLLKTDNSSIAEIAYSCGFSSQSHMTDIFRLRVGFTPAALRNSLRYMLKA